ncbi:hypothetical protein AIOL_000504 [Candidatus Rhodobacter oscarellae]|uniref:SGNH hydrolase-type esterase domain-containing protein n=1 Tax=Candidatus Rhodobacter oscarellae TaxID=1675527 RepID=A0A0J9ECH2_9RHOB|nr:SGNH/GDSL hydrolase family protein [Candidatus Rhodobacter lobularis]KMW60351.1 hypothetical protein AIOL_000504 [Candidatus Rhodobacter lobularis]
MIIRAFLAIILGLGLTLPASADKFTSPTILVLGDSQLQFGAGPVFLEFFEQLKTNCPTDAQRATALEVLSDMKVAVIGVRSTSLRSWTVTKGATKRALCEVDKKWKVNASAFGFINTTGNRYLQIGQGDAYQFCAKGKTAFEVMFRPDYYDPKLIFLNFLGNGAQRWANRYEKAVEDVLRMNAQLPPGVPCVFMTTAPSYSKKVTDLRHRAQENLKRAFETTHSHCSFVEGYSAETMAANLGNKRYFRLKKSGAVKDPYHPNERAAKNFFQIETANICNALYDQVMRKQPSWAAPPPMDLAGSTHSIHARLPGPR